MASLTIGRHSSCAIIVDDPGVSRQHAELTPAGGGRFQLRDVGSSGGTFVKDGMLWRRVQRTTVSMSDVLRLGSSELSVSDLVSRLADPSIAFDSRGQAEAQPRGAAGAVRYERDPVTGEIVEKR